MNPVLGLLFLITYFSCNLKLHNINILAITNTINRTAKPFFFQPSFWIYSSYCFSRSKKTASSPLYPPPSRSLPPKRYRLIWPHSIFIVKTVNSNGFINKCKHLHTAPDYCNLQKVVPFRVTFADGIVFIGSIPKTDMWFSRRSSRGII